LVEISPLESSSSKCEEGKRFEARISVTFQFADNIQKLVQLMLEWLKISGFNKRSKVVTRLGVTKRKPMEIYRFKWRKGWWEDKCNTTTNYRNTNILDNYKKYFKGDVTIGGKTTI
jgi:hypothetical protein